MSILFATTANRANIGSNIQKAWKITTERMKWRSLMPCLTYDDDFDASHSWCVCMFCAWIMHIWIWWRVKWNNRNSLNIITNQQSTYSQSVTYKIKSKRCLANVSYDFHHFIYTIFIHSLQSVLSKYYYIKQYNKIDHSK